MARFKTTAFASGGLAALLGAVIAVVALTGCFGAGYVWSGESDPSPTPTSTETPTYTPTSTETPTATPTATPTKKKTAKPKPTATFTPTVDPTPTNTPIPVIKNLPRGERFIVVDTGAQVARAIAGDTVVYEALITTGKAGWDTPVGTFHIQSRVYNETMQSGAGSSESWYVEDVLFTQYFTNRGHAIHLNYWVDDSAFGRVGTSHGCIGMRYSDAEYFWNFGHVGMKIIIR